MPELQVIYENSDFIVVNKAAGLISENNRFEECTVENQVLTHISSSIKKPFIGIIHRLDRVTSGLLIFAKKKSVLIKFNNLFSNRKVQKTYLAIVSKKPASNKEHLTNFLVKNNLEKRADIIPSERKDALECRLSYLVRDKNDFGYLLEVKPTTGRFHQIRAQLSNIGLPIIGDEKYGSDQKYLPLSICLHAWKLNYQDSDSKEMKSFVAPLPNNDYWNFESMKISEAL